MQSNWSKYINRYKPHKCFIDESFIADIENHKYDHIDIMVEQYVFDDIGNIKYVFVVHHMNNI